MGNPSVSALGGPGKPRYRLSPLERAECETLYEQLCGFSIERGMRDPVTGEERNREQGYLGWFVPSGFFEEYDYLWQKPPRKLLNALAAERRFPVIG